MPGGVGRQYWGYIKEVIIKNQKSLVCFISLFFELLEKLLFSNSFFRISFPIQARFFFLLLIKCVKTNE